MFGFATEKKQAEYGTAERVFGTRRADDRMKDEMLPRVRAKAVASLGELCSLVTKGAGHIEGAPRREEVRAERIFHVTEFIVEVRNAGTCMAPRAQLEPRAGELVKMLAEGKGGFSTRSALVAMKEKAVPVVLDAIRTRIGADGKLDTTEDGAHGVTNWTINHVILLVNMLKDVKTTHAQAIPTLRKLRAAVSTGNGSAWATGEIDRAIAALNAR